MKPPHGHNSFVLRQGWKFEIENLLGPHQSKQSGSEGTIPVQNTGGHCPFPCRYLYYICVQL